MPSSDVAPLPRLGEVFFDVRGDSRTMRLSWYADTGIAVFSIWQGSTCTGTFRVPIGDLPRLVDALQRGPEGAPAPGGEMPGTGPTQIHGGGAGSAYPAGAARPMPPPGVGEGPLAAQGPPPPPLATAPPGAGPAAPPGAGPAAPAGATEYLPPAGWHSDRRGAVDPGLPTDPAMPGDPRHPGRDQAGPGGAGGPAGHGAPYAGYPDALGAPGLPTGNGYPDPSYGGAADSPRPEGYGGSGPQGPLGEPWRHGEGRGPGGYAGHSAPAGYGEPASQGGYGEPHHPGGHGEQRAVYGGSLGPGADTGAETGPRSGYAAPSGGGYSPPDEFETKIDPLASGGRGGGAVHGGRASADSYPGYPEPPQRVRPYAAAPQQGRHRDTAGLPPMAPGPRTDRPAGSAEHTSLMPLDPGVPARDPGPPTLGMDPPAGAGPRSVQGRNTASESPVHQEPAYREPMHQDPAFQDPRSRAAVPPGSALPGTVPSGRAAPPESYPPDPYLDGPLPDRWEPGPAHARPESATPDAGSRRGGDGHQPHRGYPPAGSR